MSNLRVLGADSAVAHNILCERAVTRTWFLRDDILLSSDAHANQVLASDWKKIGSQAFDIWRSSGGSPEALSINELAHPGDRYGAIRTRTVWNKQATAKCDYLWTEATSAFCASVTAKTIGVRMQMVFPAIVETSAQQLEKSHINGLVFGAMCYPSIDHGISASTWHSAASLYSHDNRADWLVSYLYHIGIVQRVCDCADGEAKDAIARGLEEKDEVPIAPTGEMWAHLQLAANDADADTCSQTTLIIPETAFVVSRNDWLARENRQILDSVRDALAGTLGITMDYWSDLQ